MVSTETTHSLQALFYTNLGPSYYSAWSRGPLASNPKKLAAAKAWNKYRRALGSNYRDPTHSHINEYMVQQTSTLEEERDQAARAAQEHNSHQPIANSPQAQPPHHASGSPICDQTITKRKKPWSRLHHQQPN